MRRRIVLVLVALVLMSTALSLPAIADGHQKTVNASVTPVLIAVNVSPNSVSYGSQQLGTQNAVPTPNVVDVTNTGTVNENFLIRGANTANWQLKSAPGTDEYVHKFSINNVNFSPLTLSDQTLATNVVPTTGLINLFLKMDLPLAGSNASPQTAAVHITAVMAQ